MGKGGENYLIKLGVHMSIAGGYYRAVELARTAGCDCVQLFTKNNNQWRAKPIEASEASRFRETLSELEITDPLSHTSYLINLAAPDAALRRQSIDAMVVELQRAEQLGIPFVVVHPGSFTSSDESTGLKAIAASLDEVHRQTGKISARVLLENTAGQGSNLGWRFEQLAEIISRCAFGQRLGVCIDTCHTHAAGYPLSPAAEFERTVDEFDRVVGTSRVHAIHLNDSKTPFGSRKDRHEHIGRGTIGLAGFWLLLHETRLNAIPMYLETPKEVIDGEEMDVTNLKTLRRLAKSKRMPRLGPIFQATPEKATRAAKRKPARRRSNAWPACWRARLLDHDGRWRDQFGHFFVHLSQTGDELQVVHRPLGVAHAMSNGVNLA